VELASVDLASAGGGSPFDAATGGQLRILAPVTVSEDGGSVLLGGNRIEQGDGGSIAASIFCASVFRTGTGSHGLSVTKWFNA